MPPTLRQLVATPQLGLQVRAGSGRVDAQVRWVAVSELTDPAPFLEGGELLLTTGMNLATTAPGAKAYVDRLVKRGVTALGLSMGLTHDVVPKALVNACEKQGLPLLEIPVNVPFIEIGKEVSRLLAVEANDDLARSLDAQRALTREVLGPRGADAVVERLAREVGGWVLVLDPQGHVVRSSTPDALDRAPGLAVEVDRLRDRGMHASASVSAGGERINVHPIGVQGRARGYLAVGAPEPWSGGRTAVVNLAVSLLSLDSERSRVDSLVQRHLQTAAVRMALSGGVHELPLAELGWGALKSGPVVVAVVDGAITDLEVLLERCEDAGDLVAARVDDSVVVLVSDGQHADEAIVDVIAGLESVSAGSATIDGLDELEVGVRRARQAGAAAGPAEQLARYDDVARGGLLGLVDADAAQGFADSVLAPIYANSSAEDLLDSLDAWLSRHGQWDAAAHELGVHRHTLRHRIRRIEQLLGRSLDDPAVRMELWFALRQRSLRP